jgi:hypothetical protein
MGLSRYLAILALAAAPTVTAIDLAQAQSRGKECVVAGIMNPFGANSNGTLDINSGESCALSPRIDGMIQSSKVTQRPKNGTLTMTSISTATYKAKAGFKGTDEFAVSFTGRGPLGVGTSIVRIRANVK